MKNIGKRLLLLFIALLTVLPLAYILVVSFESKGTYYKKVASPDLTDLTFANYVTMAQNFGIWSKLFNTLLITLLTVLFTLLFAIPLAYTITKISRKPRMLVIVMLMLFSFVPEQVTILSKYKMFLGLGLNDSIVTVILLLVSQQLSFTTLMLYYLFTGVPQPLYWAAELDGCSELKEVVFMTVPIAKGGIVVQAILGVVLSWNSLLIPMVFLRSESIKTIMPAIAALDRRYGTNVPLQMAGLVMASIPVMILYGVFRKRIVDQLDVGMY